MADKFPEISDVPADGQEASGDFLSREKELLGDEFATEGDKEVADNDEEEFEEFESQYPEVNAGEAAEGVPQTSTSKEPEVIKKFSNLNMDESEPVKEWKQKQATEISKRDEVNGKKLEEIKSDAQKATDDFYENYNNKKDELIASAKKDEAEFLKKRDSFLDQGTVWDRVVDVLQLTKNSDSVDEANYRDKTRFKELLLSLKGKENVPGAQGVSESQ
ncbi:DEKNAAC100192 [Brettanomyces naardenensis]|uniref:Clathrin light chain n=1 Tax=Brettanomyces naardenensis TaxID=13370 RepID=A0A448YFI7_BRENA|nr:DEKNAAC100192 [Brettanomyces naardenensis]